MKNKISTRASAEELERQHEKLKRRWIAFVLACPRADLVKLSVEKGIPVGLELRKSVE